MPTYDGPTVFPQVYRLWVSTKKIRPCPGGARLRASKPMRCSALAVSMVMAALLGCAFGDRLAEVTAEEYWRPLTAALAFFPFKFALSISDDTGLLYLYEKGVDYFEEKVEIQR